MTDLANIDPAWAACAGVLGAAACAEPPEAAVRRLAEAREALERRRDQLAAGDSLAILQAIAECAEADLPLPHWLRTAYTQRLVAFVSDPTAPATLDELFSSPNLRPGPKRRLFDRRQWDLGRRLWLAVRAKEAEHRSLNSALDAVLKEGNWPVRKTQARPLVLRFDRFRGQLTGGRECLHFSVLRLSTPKTDAEADADSDTERNEDANDMTGHLLRIHEAARRLNVSERTIRNLIASDPTFPVVVLGGRSRRVPETGLEAYLQAKRLPVAGVKAAE